MKTIQTILAITMFASALPAMASSMQFKCSNVDGTVRTDEDFRDQEIVMTEKIYSNEGVVSREIKFGRGELIAKDIKNTSVNEISNGKCDGAVGWYSVQAFSYKQVQFKKADGSAFSEDLAGGRLSQDKKTLEVHMLCERHVTGQRPCGNR